MKFVLVSSVIVMLFVDLIVATKNAECDEIEAFLNDISDKIEQTEYQQWSTVTELDAIRKHVKAIRVSIEDTEAVDDYKDRLKKLKSISTDLIYRHDQAKNRPKALGTLKQLINSSFIFLKGMRNLSNDFEEEIFTETELNDLEKLIFDTGIWLYSTELELNATKPHEKPTITVSDIAEAIHELDREVQYLISKFKYVAPTMTRKKEKTTEEREEEYHHYHKENEL